MKREMEGTGLSATVSRQRYAWLTVGNRPPKSRKAQGRVSSGLGAGAEAGLGPDLRALLVFRAYNLLSNAVFILIFL